MPDEVSSTVYTFFCARCGEAFYAPAATDRCRGVLCGECAPWNQPERNILLDLALAARAAYDTYPTVVQAARDDEASVLSEALDRLLS